MSREKRIRIFLGSPGDVPSERKLVHKVVRELNEVVGREKNVFFDLYDSGHAYPAYGSDGQDIINQQIGEMQAYNIVLVIMWNRIGTPTPRDISGTVEEFHRAVAARKRRQKPDIWLFFRTGNPSSKTKVDQNQQKEVVKFKQQIRGKGLFREFQSPSQFEEILRQSLQRWLHDLLGKSAVARPRKTTRQRSATEAEDQLSPTKGATKLTKAVKPSLGKARRTTIVKEVKSWAMIDKEFYRLEADKTQRDQTVILRLSPLTVAQAAHLRSLQPTAFARTAGVACAYGIEAAVLQIQSVESETTAGKSTVTLTLTPSHHAQPNHFGLEFTYQNYGPEEIARMRACLILLNEPLPRDLARLVPSIQIGFQNTPLMEITEGIFPALWGRLNTTTQGFLPKAWLWAAFMLKASGIVETITTLELGPVNKKVMRICFQGKRKQIYSNQEPHIIKIEGECRLEQ